MTICYQFHLPEDIEPSADTTQCLLFRLASLMHFKSLNAYCCLEQEIS